MRKIKRNEEVYNYYKNNGVSIEKLCEMYSLSKSTIKNIIYRMEYKENGIPYYNMKLNKHNVYPNIEKERIMEGLYYGQLAKLMGMSSQVLTSRLRGRSEFSLKQAIQLKEALNSDLSIEELFKREDE